MEVQILQVVDDVNWQKALWQIYEKAFIEDRDIYPHDQINYTYDSFIDTLIDGRVTKFILIYDDKPVGFMIVIDHQHAEHAPWTNFKAFTNKRKSKEFIYINVLAVDPEYQRKGIGLELVDAIIDWALGVKGTLVAGFDAPQEKDYLVKLVKDRCAQKEVAVELLGAQHYWILTR